MGKRSQGHEKFDFCDVLVGIVYLLYGKNRYLPADFGLIGRGLANLVAKCEDLRFLTVFPFVSSEPDSYAKLAEEFLSSLAKENKIYIATIDGRERYAVCCNRKLFKEWSWDKQHKFNLQQIELLQRMADSLYDFCRKNS
jgi:hypothetical protein